MKSNTYIQILMAVSFAVLITACGSSIAIQNVDFSQPLEVVGQPDNSGLVSDIRTGVSFSVLPLLEKEGITSNEFSGTDVRMIRNHQGYYFVTAAGFKNVYVMQSRENELRSEKVIPVASQRLQNPSFNQRNPYIQLLDGDTSMNLTVDGIQS